MARPARAVSATTRSCGNGAAPSPSCSAVPVQPNVFRFAVGVRDVHQHPVGGAHHHPGQQHRRRLIVADQRPGRPPEQGLHQVRRHQQPPAVTTFSVGTCHSSGERDIREQPGQPGQRLAVRRVRHQGHRDHQPDDQRIRHDPPPLPLPQPALLQRRRRDLLDHPVTEVPLQLAQPHEIRQPPARPHAAIPADDAPARSPPGGRTPPARPPTAPRSPAVTVPPPRTRRSAARTRPVSRQESPPAGTPLSGLHQRRQADKKAQGLLETAWTRHPQPYQEPLARANHSGRMPGSHENPQVTLSWRPELLSP